MFTLETKMKKLKFLQAFLFVVAFFSCSSKKEKIQNPQKIENYAEFNKIIPKRIVSLSPAATELLAEAGAVSQIAARTDFCDYPEEVLQIESLGGFDGKSISQEKLLSFSPDLVCLTSGMHDYLTEFLESQKINYYILSQNSVSMILNDLLNLGKITGNAETAQKNAQKIQNRLNQIKAKTENLPKVSVYWEVWDSPLMSIGKNSFITELISISGGKNIFDSINADYPLVSEEEILFKNPDLIIFPSENLNGKTKIQNRDAWKNLSAVKEQKIFPLDANSITRPGSRIAESTEILLKIFHPEI